MFDYNMILMDGSKALTAATDTAAISTTRLTATGAVVIDLGTGGTPASGLVAVMYLSAAAAADATSTWVAVLQASNTEDMTAATDVEGLGSFGVANATSGTILGSETPCWATIRFATKKRYVRVSGTATIVDTSMGNCYCFLIPWDSFKFAV